MSNLSEAFLINKYCFSILHVSILIYWYQKLIGIMPKTVVDTIDKVLIKCMDFLEFLATFSQDWKIGELKNL